jgi:GNAT superfamily N-acetyltransferase
VPVEPSRAPHLNVTTWYLEMRARPHAAARPAPAGTTLVRLERPSTHFYRYLYETVGGPWLWVERRRMSDEQLGAIIGDPDVAIFVAYRGGAPAGYFELDATMPREVELSYFGLVPDAIGQGLGRWLIDAAVHTAWSLEGIDRVWVHTCSLDHPRALANYEAAGFVKYDERREPIWDPRPLPITPR